jgi:precorrin-6B methylase 2
VIQFCLATLCALCLLWGAIAPAAWADVYQNKRMHDPDGIGRLYQGREIAKVIGHEGAYWLERPDRELEERPQQLLEALQLSPDSTVAEIGAGSGYMTARLARVLPLGKVYAVDIQPEMVKLLQNRQRRQWLPNVQPVLGSDTEVNLAEESLDLVLMVDAYHEFAYPREMLDSVFAALKPNGRVVLAEYRAENPFVPIKRLHKMSERQVKRELKAAGLIWEKTDGRLPQQHLLFFRKPAL